MIPFGTYHLVLELGRGGMATAYLAVAADEITATPHLRVVKRLNRELLGDESLRQMFLDELSLSMQLSHPNIVTTHQVGVVDGEYFIAMEYLDGVPLTSARKAARETPEDQRRLASLEPYVAHEILQALQYAHTACAPSGEPLGVIHRDVSPHNVFVTYDGQVKLLDFGIAKMAHRSHHTATGVIKGKVRYMAPEQLRSPGAVDARADLFAVGVMLWEGLASRPFWGKDRLDPDIMVSLLSGEIRSALPEDAPGGVAWQAVLDEALAASPAARFASARDFARALRSPPLAIDVPASREELAAFLTSRFASRRQAAREAIEIGLRKRREAAAAPPSGKTTSGSMLVAPPSLPRIQMNDTPSGARSDGAAVDGALATSIVRTAAPPRRRVGVVAGIVASAGIALAATAIGVRAVPVSGSPPDPLPAQPTAPVEAASPVASPPSSAEAAASPSPSAVEPSSASAAPSVSRPAEPVIGRPPSPRERSTSAGAHPSAPRPVASATASASSTPSTQPAPSAEPSAQPARAPAASARRGRAIDHDNPFRSSQ